jgi:hypothetical protein
MAREQIGVAVRDDEQQNWTMLLQIQHLFGREAMQSAIVNKVRKSAVSASLDLNLVISDRNVLAYLGQFEEEEVQFLTAYSGFPRSRVGFSRTIQRNFSHRSDSRPGQSVCSTEGRTTLARSYHVD